jgi:hypothetical protein
MKIIILLSIIFGLFVPKIKAQFTPDFQFYLYITDAIGNKDSLLIGYTNNDTITQGVWGANIGTAAFKDTLEMRLVDWDLAIGATTFNSWREVYVQWDCTPIQSSGTLPIAFSCMHPPVYLSWNDTLFQDNCRDNSTITTSEMYLQHPEVDEALHVKMSAQSYIYTELDTTGWFRYNYPQTIVPNQIMQSGATDTLFFMYMTFSNDPLITSVSPETAHTGIKVYPTATYNILNIDIETPEEVEILIFDMQGHLVKQETEQIYELNIGDFPAGIYIIQIRNGKRWHKQKIVKY